MKHSFKISEEFSSGIVCEIILEKYIYGYSYLSTDNSDEYSSEHARHCVV